MSVVKNLTDLNVKIEGELNLCGRKREDLTLVAVSKGASVEAIQEAYSADCRDFGENRVQEALEKMDQLPSDIRWHFIGKLQKNKVNKVVGRFALIHSVDSVELAERISKASEQRGVTTAILLEVNTSGEESKSGLSPAQWESACDELFALTGVEVRGLMAMAPFTEDEEVIGHCFSELRHLRDRLQAQAGARATLSTLSMGMSRDFPLAIREGSTMIRIGSAIFHETC